MLVISIIIYTYNNKILLSKLSRGFDSHPLRFISYLQNYKNLLLVRLQLFQLLKNGAMVDAKDWGSFLEYFSSFLVFIGYLQVIILTINCKFISLKFSILIFVDIV